MKSVLVLGGGLSGIAAAVALAENGCSVKIVERHRFLGGRAAAFPHEGSWLDNCQHVILGCCVNLLDLLEKLDTRNLITFHSSIPFLANGKTTVLKPAGWPAPFHFFPDFFKARLFSAREKLGALRLFSKLLILPETNTKLDEMTMMEWLKRQKQSSNIIENFWKIILVSTINETLQRMSAKYGVMVLKTAFLPNPESALMGTPAVSLAELYHEAAGKLFDKLGVKIVQGKVKTIGFEEEKPFVLLEDETRLEAEELVCALPFYNLLPLLPEKTSKDPFFARFVNLETSPILGIHLWFDRKVTDEPFGALPGSPIHWFFVKPEEKGAHYVQLVISACRDYMKTKNEDLINLGLSELGRYLPLAVEAKLLKWNIVREARATFSAGPGCDAYRPTSATPVPHFYLAGDWTDTGWPPTMEGAVRSGYRCAEQILSKKIMKDELAPSGFGFLLPGIKKMKEFQKRSMNKAI